MAPPAGQGIEKPGAVAAVVGADPAARLDIRICERAPTQRRIEREDAGRMAKISTMYRWSGGTDYHNTCYECTNCLRIKRGSRTGYKCQAYGVTEGHETDWNHANIACKHFNQPPPEIPVIELGRRKSERKESTGEIPGQMDIMDFLGGPERRRSERSG